MAMTTCKYEFKWLKAILADLGVLHPRAISLQCDNQVSLHISQNLVFHERTKHIEVDYHFLRNALVGGIISPSHVPSTTQLGDIFTKAMGRSQFKLLLGKLGILDFHAPS